MEGFKEFQGKDLDGAIEEACGYFNTAREKLEIEIVQDAKSGIFGIVGARKAKVRARRVQLRETVDNILGRKGSDGAASAQNAGQNSGQASGQPVNQAGDDAPVSAETRKNGGRPTPVAQSAVAASGTEVPVAEISAVKIRVGKNRVRRRLGLRVASRMTDVAEAATATGPLRLMLMKARKHWTPPVMAM